MIGTIADKKNRASVAVERSVARVIVTIAKDFTKDLRDTKGEVIGTISNPAWGVSSRGELSICSKKRYMGNSLL